MRLDESFALNGRCEPRYAPSQREFSFHTRHLQAEADNRPGSARDHRSMTSTRLDATIATACLVYALVATLGWALPSLLHLLRHVGGYD